MARSQFILITEMLVDLDLEGREAFEINGFLQH